MARGLSEAEGVSEAEARVITTTPEIEKIIISRYFSVW